MIRKKKSRLHTPDQMKYDPQVNMVLNAHCKCYLYLSTTLCCLYCKSNKFYRELWMENVFCLFFLTVGLFQFWESSQMFDLHHQNKARRNLNNTGKQLANKSWRTWPCVKHKYVETKDSNVLCSWQKDEQHQLSRGLSPSARDKNFSIRLTKTKQKHHCNVEQSSFS